jgi:hypothetical protein
VVQQLRGHPGQAITRVETTNPNPKNKQGGHVRPLAESCVHKMRKTTGGNRSLQRIMESSSVFVGLAFGGIASCIAEGFTLPVDTIKTRLQLQVRVARFSPGVPGNF